MRRTDGDKVSCSHRLVGWPVDGVLLHDFFDVGLGSSTRRRRRGVRRQAPAGQGLTQTEHARPELAMV